MKQETKMNFETETVDVDRIRESEFFKKHYNRPAIVARNFDRELRENGQTMPLVIDRDTNEIIIGVGQFRAMKRLGWEECECIRCNGRDRKSVTRILCDLIK